MPIDFIILFFHGHVFRNLRPNQDAANFLAEKLVDQLVVAAALGDHPVEASVLVGVADQADSRKDHHEVDIAGTDLVVALLAEAHLVVVMLLSTEPGEEDPAAVADLDVGKEGYPLADRTEEGGNCHPRTVEARHIAEEGNLPAVAVGHNDQTWNSRPVVAVGPRSFRRVTQLLFLLVTKALKKGGKLLRFTGLENLCVVTFHDLPVVVEPIVWPATVALETTESLACSTTSFVLLVNPRSPCQVFPRASLTALVVSAGMSWFCGGCRGGLCCPYCPY